MSFVEVFCLRVSFIFIRETSTLYRRSDTLSTIARKCFYFNLTIGIEINPILFQILHYNFTLLLHSSDSFFTGCYNSSVKKNVLLSTYVPNRIHEIHLKTGFMCLLFCKPTLASFSQFLFTCHTRKI